MYINSPLELVLSVAKGVGVTVLVETDASLEVDMVLEVAVLTGSATKQDKIINIHQHKQKLN